MKTAKLVQFGNGTDSVDYGNGCSGSGYGSPESPHASADCNIPNGTPAIDKRDAVRTPAGYDWVFKGPLVNVDLPIGQVERCPKSSPLLRAGIAGNSYGNLLALHEASTTGIGPLDSVDIETYVNGWRAHGARIGHYMDGKIMWE